MLLLQGLRGVNSSAKRLVTSARRCKKEFTSCVENKNLLSRPGCHQQEIPKDYEYSQVLSKLTVCQSKADIVWRSLKVLSSRLGQQDCWTPADGNDAIPSKDGKMETDALSSSPDANVSLSQCLAFSVVQQQLNESTAVFNTTSSAYWLAGYQQGRSWFDGPFAKGREDVLTYLNRSAGPLSHVCRGLHLEPARYCNIPSSFNDIVVMDQRLGITLVSQLCAESQERLKQIAHERLKKALRANKVKVVKNQPVDYPGEGLFKSPLLFQVKEDKRFRKAASRVPALLRYIVAEIHKRNLDSPGLFRVSGDSARVAKLKSHLETNFYVTECIDSSGYDIHDFATLLKDYLRDLPARLISTEKFEIFPDIQDLDFETQQYPIMNYFHLSMTEEHRQTLQYLLSFLGEVSRHSGKNQMDVDKLAVVFGPLLFKMADMPVADMAQKVSHQVNMTRAWMFYYPKLALVPYEMMEEVRKSFSSKPLTITFDPKVFPEAPKPPSVPKNLKKLTEANITVLTPYESQPSVLVKIDSKHTAQHVVCAALGIPLDPFDIAPSDTSLDKYPPLDPVLLHDLNKERGQGDTKPAQYLHEVGGNIGERRLNENTKMLELYKSNPKAFWVLKALDAPPIHTPVRRVSFKLK